MDAQLTTSEINTFRDTLKDYDPALEALATLEEQGGQTAIGYKFLSHLG